MGVIVPLHWGQYSSLTSMMLSSCSLLKGVRECFLCPFCDPLFRLFRRRDLSLEGLTMSEEGGLEELLEFFLWDAISALNSTISARSFSMRAACSDTTCFQSIDEVYSFFRLDKRAILSKMQKCRERLHGKEHVFSEKVVDSRVLFAASARLRYNTIVTHRSRCVNN